MNLARLLLFFMLSCHVNCQQQPNQFDQYQPNNQYTNNFGAAQYANEIQESFPNQPQLAPQPMKFNPPASNVMRPQDPLLQGQYSNQQLPNQAHYGIQQQYPQLPIQPQPGYQVQQQHNPQNRIEPIAIYPVVNMTQNSPNNFIEQQPEIAEPEKILDHYQPDDMFHTQFEHEAEYKTKKYTKVIMDKMARYLAKIINDVSENLSGSGDGNSKNIWD